MRKREPHVDDDRLIEVYLDREGDRALGAASHLQTCEACSARYQALAGSMDRLRRAVTAEADGIFTPAHLARQREEIMRRLEQAANSARILPFPAPQRSPTVSRTTFRRWIAGAAAAGLLIGLSAGRLFDLPRGAWWSPSLEEAVGTGTDPVQSASRATFGVPASDEVFLGELDAALAGLGIAELQAIDALTPQIVEAAAGR
jgi:hypothetical protein